jgi:hypothetical protein
MDERTFNLTKKLLEKFRYTDGRVKISNKYAQFLNYEYNFGKVRGDYLVFTPNDRADLIRKVKSIEGLDLFLGEFNEKQGRLETARTDRNEKSNSYPVARDYVMINSLKYIKLNQEIHEISHYTAFGLTINAEHITSIEHEKIVFVENLEIMAVLAKLNMPTELQDALWVFRGQPKKERHTEKAYQFFRRFKNTHQLICFSDLDPKGIEIALTSEAEYWLTPEDSDVINIDLKGFETEWSKQENAIKYLKGKVDLPIKCKIAFEKMLTNRKTLKQEHMLPYNIKLGLFAL